MATSRCGAKLLTLWPLAQSLSSVCLTSPFIPSPACYGSKAMGTCGSTEAKPRHDDIRARLGANPSSPKTPSPRRGRVAPKSQAWPAGRLGSFSNHGWEEKPPSIFATKGPVKPKVNQDRIFITPKINDRDDCWLFACFDGNVHKVKKWLSKQAMSLYA